MGALTSKEFRFKERVWFLTSANSVCPECSRGCSARFDTYKGEILRLVPRDNPKVNGPWMCDHGRLLSERLKDASPAGRPMVRGPKGWAPLPWEEMARALSEKAQALRGRGARDLAAILLSGRMTLEEMAAFKRLSGALLGGIQGVALQVTRGEDDALLIRKERRPNLRGAELLGIPVAPQNALPSKILAGKKAALIVREDVVGDAEASEKQALSKLLSGMDLVVVADTTFTETAALAHLFIPLALWHEMEGVTVNFLSVAQKTARAVVPPKQRRTFYEAVSLWLKAAGQEAPAPEFLAWHAEVKQALPGLKEVMIRDLLPHGVQLQEVKP